MTEQVYQRLSRVCTSNSRVTVGTGDSTAHKSLFIEDFPAVHGAGSRDMVLLRCYERTRDLCLKMKGLVLASLAICVNVTRGLLQSNSRPLPEGDEKGVWNRLKTSFLIRPRKEFLSVLPSSSKIKFKIIQWYFSQVEQEKKRNERSS